MKEVAVRHTGKIQRGKLILDNRELFLWDLENFEGKTVELIIKGVKNTRSLNMNSYYWAVVMASLTKYFNEEQTFNKKVDINITHALMKDRFLGDNIWTLPNGEELKEPEGSSGLSNQEFIDYFENIIAWAAEMFGLEIPKPNEREMLAIDIEDKDKHIG